MTCPVLPILPADLTNRFGQAKGWNARVAAFNTTLCATLDGLEQALAAMQAASAIVAGLEDRMDALEGRVDAVEEAESEAIPGWVTVNTTPYNVSGIVGGLLVNTLNGAKTIQLPAAVGYLNRVLVVKDDSGLAATNNITVIPAGTNTIDDDVALIIDSNYASAQLKATATGWEIV